METEKRYKLENPERRKYYREALTILERTGVPYGVLGGFGQYHYGRGRWPSKDLDIAILPDDVGLVLKRFDDNSSFRVEHKHPSWLNQIWSPGQPSYSIDLIHRHSTGLIEAKPWWFEEGKKGEFLGGTTAYVAPESIALTKTLLWSRRPHDLPDAIRVVAGSEETYRPFKWNLLIDELHADWRLAYGLAVLTEQVSEDNAAGVIPKETKAKLHSSFSNNPIPGPTRGHIFAYDSFPGAGEESSWHNRHGIIYNQDDDTISSTAAHLRQWQINSNAFTTASRIFMSRGRNFDWNHLMDELQEEWRLGLSLMIYTEVLYGESGSQAIDPSSRTSFSRKFLETS